LLQFAAFSSLSQEPPGSVDKSFFIGPGADATVYTITVQTDGKILVGGAFDQYYGTNRHRLARVNPNGSVDPTFDSPITDPVAHVLAIAVQTNGQILVGLDAGTSLMRLSSSGVVDTNFNVLGAGPNGAVHAIVLQPDGKILIGGEFTRYNGALKGRIARLNTDGTLDGLFNPLSGADYDVFAIALQADDRIIVGGQFQLFAGLTRNFIARLNPNGSLDGTFGGTGANYYVDTIAIQPDGKAVIGGFFSSYDGHPQNAVARLNTNGTYDASFQSIPELEDGTVAALQLQRDGKVVVGGDMTQGHLVRLNTDGTKDSTYQPGYGPGDDVYAMTTQADQKILIGGLFTSVDIASTPHFARINADLKMFNPTRTGSQFSAQIQTVAGKTYRLEHQTVLGSPTWTSVLGSDVSGDGSMKLIHDPNASSTPRFYRVFGQPD